VEEQEQPHKVEVVEPEVIAQMFLVNHPVAEQVLKLPLLVSLELLIP
jgi:hypothetical protein